MRSPGLIFQNCFLHETSRPIHQAWRLASTSVGGRLRIARNPNQGIFCSWGQKTLKNGLDSTCLWVHSVSTEGWRPFRDTPALKENRITSIQP